MGLEAGESTSGRQNPAIYATPIVQQIADGYLQFEALGGGGGWGGVGGVGRLWEAGAVGGRDIHGRREGGFDTEGTEAEKKRVHVAGVRECDGAGDSVVVESKTEKLRGDRVGLHLVQGRQGRDKEIEVDFGVIFHSKVVDDENKTDRAS